MGFFLLLLPRCQGRQWTFWIDILTSHWGRVVWLVGRNVWYHVGSLKGHSGSSVLGGGLHNVVESGQILETSVWILS